MESSPSRSRGGRRRGRGSCTGSVLLWWRISYGGRARMLGSAPSSAEARNLPPFSRTPCPLIDHPHPSCTFLNLVRATRISTQRPHLRRWRRPPRPRFPASSSRRRLPHHLILNLQHHNRAKHPSYPADQACQLSDGLAPAQPGSSAPSLCARAVVLAWDPPPPRPLVVAVANHPG